MKGNQLEGHCNNPDTRCYVKWRRVEVIVEIEMALNLETDGRFLGGDATCSVNLK